MHPNQPKWDKAHRARKQRSDFVQVRLWVPRRHRDAIVAFAEQLRQRDSADGRDA